MAIYIQIYNWLVVSTPLKNMKVSWDYYSQYMESHKNSMVPTHQADNIHYFVKLHAQMHPIPWYFSNGVPE
jgi:hypothetical protein